ncbi:pilus (MSHA type) biogenesis protein MshL [Sulfuricurvum sp.]|uniref:pilus (MSHA type) biogenesis protein MshL n=1 Tax=Sulfuricurvum sp. TaxID=2025608 RepID=UPI002632D90A|nr:pilus (MSHA type) biogenesis protein MshL [Sulfuricurvum sp.]MDD2780151.1 pilus (MSHA type) biogenesis protein MshL [Sulfuricurvum sp.]
MTSIIKHHARAFMLSVATAALLSPTVHADCTYELFNISSVKGTSVGEFVDQLSDECGMSVIVTDEQAENVLKKPMNKTFLKNLTINEVFDLIIKENNLQYTLQNNVLKISYLTTKTYNIDYITTERKGTGSTNIRLSSNSGTAAGAASGSAKGTGANNASSESGTNISTIDEVKFWDTLEQEVKSILSRPEDDYKQNNTLNQVLDTKADPTKAPEQDSHHNIFINKSAGLVTVTGTGKQIQRLDGYINELQKKMHTQVLIDVKMYSVVFSDGASTGIDWSQLYALQNIDLSFNRFNLHNAAGFKATSEGTTNIMFPYSEVSPLPGVNIGTNIFQLGAKGSLNEVVKFLKTQGDVYSISNPKILTLNNQPALITAGTELFYKTKSSSTLAGGTTGTTSQTDIVSSVFSGVLLDITPEIAGDGSITLRINPSISETASEISTNNSTRDMPPDLSRRQISSVITVKDGSRVILGGLINTKNVQDDNKVPFLGDIPVLGYLFKREAMSKRTEEIVIIIEPHIIKKEKDTISLGDLGYTRLGRQIEEEAKQESK